MPNTQTILLKTPPIVRVGKFDKHLNQTKNETCEQWMYSESSPSQIYLCVFAEDLKHGTNDEGY